MWMNQKSYLFFSVRLAKIWVIWVMSLCMPWDEKGWKSLFWVKKDKLFVELLRRAVGEGSVEPPGSENNGSSLRKKKKISPKPSLPHPCREREKKKGFWWVFFPRYTFLSHGRSFLNKESSIGKNGFAWISQWLMHIYFETTVSRNG